MGSPAVYIVVEPSSGNAVSIARIESRWFLRSAALTAVAEAESKIASLGAKDPILADMQKDEVGRLKSALHRLVPDLRLEAAALFAEPCASATTKSTLVTYGTRQVQQPKHSML